MIYEIKIKGLLDQSWSAWLGDLKIRVRRKKDGSVITTLIADVIDQATLFAVIDHIRDLNLLLVSVNPQKSRGSQTNTLAERATQVAIPRLPGDPLVSS